MEGVEEVFKMKKKEIQEVYDLFITCLPKNCIRPRIFKIYSSWRRMIKIDWPNLDGEKLFGGIDRTKIYSKSERLADIHGGYALCRHEFYNSNYSAMAIGNFTRREISLYSRAYRGDIYLIIVLLHEVGHLNVPYSGDAVQWEKDIEEWMWRCWPYVFGRYKKLKI